MSKKLREQFEKETGDSAYSQGFQHKLYNEKYVEWLEQRLEAGQHETIVIPFQSETDAINWVWENMPMAVKPTSRSKKHWIHPYKSKHCRRQIANCIGEKLWDRSRLKLKLGDKIRK